MRGAHYSPGLGAGDTPIMPPPMNSVFSGGSGAFHATQPSQQQQQQQMYGNPAFSPAPRPTAVSPMRALNLTRQVSSPPGGSGAAAQRPAPMSLFSPQRDATPGGGGPSPMATTPTAAAPQHPQIAATPAAGAAGVGAGVMRVTPEADGSAWVTVFGFATEDTNSVLRALESCGDVIRWVPPAGRANWAHALFKTAHEAQDALTKNGVEVRRGLMVGVRPLEQNQRVEVEGGGAGIAMASAGAARRGAADATAARPYYMGSSAKHALPQPDHSFWGKVQEHLLGW